jgi:endonuclease-3
MSVEETHKYLEKLFPAERYYDAHLNLIRLGREICAARKPACARCPLQEICNYARAML